ncbi:hypothetical protein ACS0TY_005370 [Phlomoides rotata]
MATSALPSLLLLFLFAATVSARPCKTIFFFSATTTTTTFFPHNSLPANPNPNPNSIFRNQNPRYLTLIFTSTNRNPIEGYRPSLNFDSKPSIDDNSQKSPAIFPLKFYSSVSSSIRERTKDIMSVVGALLFGVGCGALTAAIMYFLWALCSPSRFDFIDSSSSDDDDDDDVTASKKKLGYVTIPTNYYMIEEDLKKSALPPKEVV